MKDPEFTDPTKITAQDIFNIIEDQRRRRVPADRLYQIYAHLRPLCSEPFTEEMASKLVGIIHDVQKNEQGFTDAVKNWVNLQNGVFTVFECCRDLCATEPNERTNVRVALHRLCKQDIIQAVGDKSGVYRPINRNLERMNYIDVAINPFDANWPLFVEDFCVVQPGNVVIIAGTKSAGKTAYALNFADMNADKWAGRIHYFNSEMKEFELNMRLRKFERPSKEWFEKINFHPRYENFADVIVPDDINIIDYMTVYDEFWKIAGLINDVGQRLRQGIALINLQKNKGSEFARGGQSTIDLSRLYITLEHISNAEGNKAIVLDAKIPKRENENVRGLTCQYHLIQGEKFEFIDRWHHPSDEEREEEEQKKKKAKRKEKADKYKNQFEKED